MQEAAFDATQFLAEEITSFLRLYHLAVADLTLIAAALWLLAIERFIDLVRKQDA